MGNNYREVDLTANALINVGAIHESTESNISTYSVNSNSTTLYEFESDTIGNITNVSGVDINWNGRRLESISQNGTVVVSYDYNIDGQRVKKNITDPETGTIITTEYFYNGDILAGEKTGNNVIIYMYDNNGDIFGFTYNGTEYYYIKNAQNDVVAIADANGNIVVRYYYNAWGEIIDCVDNTTFGLSSINPITYRSYYNDNIVGMDMYYLNSRYYMADWGRFVSADAVVSGVGGDQLGYNMFAYCQNNPVNYCDPNGNWLEKFKETAKKVADKVENWVIDVVCSVKYFVNYCIPVKYDVPLYNQGSTSICWAYSQAMIEDFNTGTRRTPEGANGRAKEIAVQLNGEDNWNQGNRPANKSTVKQESIEELYMALKANGPLYASYGLYDENGVRVNGHAIVVTGVNVLKGQVYTNNPWGITGEQSYDEFLNVFVGAEESGWKLDVCFSLG